VIRTVQPVPRWAVITTFVLSLIGLGLSIFLTISHFDNTVIINACPTGTGFFDCIKVTTSAQSYFLGIPVAILGLGTYLVMTVLNSPWVWRAKNYWLHVARFVIAIISMLFVLWLFYAELIIIKQFCEYCTAVHVVTFALLVVLTIVSPTQLGWARSRAQ
jgi:uncharacterized membrane protein